MRTRTLLCLPLLFFAAPSQSQFIKHVDEQGHITYSDDPGYDYARDEPSDPDRRAAQDRQRALEEWLDSRQAAPPPEPVPPAVSVRRRTHCQRVTRTLCDR